MLATNKILILSAVLLAVPPARADQNTSADPLFFVDAEPLHDAQFRSDDSGTGWVEPVFKGGSYDPSIKSEIQTAQGKNTRMVVDRPAGLHWDTTAQRPSLAYQFTDNGVIHVHGSAHGAMINVSWSY